MNGKKQNNPLSSVKYYFYEIEYFYFNFLIKLKAVQIIRDQIEVLESNDSICFSAMLLLQTLKFNIQVSHEDRYQ